MRQSVCYTTKQWSNPRRADPGDAGNPPAAPPAWAASTRGAHAPQGEPTANALGGRDQGRDGRHLSPPHLTQALRSHRGDTMYLSKFHIQTRFDRLSPALLRWRIAWDVRKTLYDPPQWAGTVYVGRPLSLGCLISFCPSGPRRLARPRTSPFHGGNTGSNPVGDATFPACPVSPECAPRTEAQCMHHAPSALSPILAVLTACFPGGE